MREYLNPLKDGGYELSDSPICTDSIEVPGGAVKAYLNNSGSINFINENDDYANAATHGVWVDTHRGRHEASGHELVWQRDKPVDAEPKSENPWDAQVGGDHYKHYKIQPMQFALENNLNPLQHSVIKYVMRHEQKNGKQDLEKAKHYIDLMISHYYG